MSRQLWAIATGVAKVFFDAKNRREISGTLDPICLPGLFIDLLVWQATRENCVHTMWVDLQI